MTSIDELMAAVRSGDVSLADAERRLADPASEPMIESGEENLPPSELHRWDGESWVLPAEHEISMLDQMMSDGHIKKNEYDKLAREAQKRLKHEQEEVSDAG